MAKIELVKSVYYRMIAWHLVSIIWSHLTFSKILCLRGCLEKLVMWLISVKLTNWVTMGLN